MASNDVNSHGLNNESIYQKLIALSEQTNLQEQYDYGFPPATSASQDIWTQSNLLHKLVQEEKLDVLVLTLYRGERGYSLALKTHQGILQESACFSYEEAELLSYIDNEELPPVLVDLLDEVDAHIYYNGCVVLELRDFRRTLSNSPAFFKHVLLKPTTQSIIADVQILTKDKPWAAEDKMLLESQLLLATSEPLCLDPTPRVTLHHNSLQFQHLKLNSSPIKRQAKKFSHNALHRKKLRERMPMLAELKLHAFIKAKREKIPHSMPKTSTMLAASHLSSMAPPTQEIDVKSFAKPIERPKETVDCSPVTIEEYLFETERVNGRTYMVKLTIMQRPAVEQYLGELYVDRDFKEGKLGGASCQFVLGSRPHVNRYIQQFTEIFTEEGRKPVKITHQVPGHPPRIMLTQGMREKEREREKAELLVRNAPSASHSNATIANKPIVSRSNPAPEQNVSSSAAPIMTGASTVPLTKVALLESLKAGQVPPNITALVSNFVNAQQQQNMAAVANSGPSLVIANGNQSLLRPQLARASGGTVSLAPMKTVVRPTTLASLLTTRVNPQSNNVAAKVSVVLPETANASQKVNVATLVGQLIRPSSTTINSPILPTYSQALSHMQTAQVTSTRPVMSKIQINSTGLSPVATMQGNQSSNRRQSGTLSENSASANSSPNANNPNSPARLSLNVPGLSALLAGTPSADTLTSTSVTVTLPALLERLQSTPKAQPNVVNSTGTTGTVQSINLAGIQGAMASITGLQNIQVSIPGLSMPLSLSLGVASSPSTHNATTVVNSNNGIAVRPIAVATSGSQQLSVPLSVLQVSGGNTPVQLIGALQRPNTTVVGAPRVMTPMNSRVATPGAQGVQLTAQQQLQLALQRQVQIQSQQKSAGAKKKK